MNKHYKPSYTAGVEYIAFNDEPTCLDESEIRDSISVQTLAVAFNVEAEKIANAVLRLRLKYSIWQIVSLSVFCTW